MKRSRISLSFIFISGLMLLFSNGCGPGKPYQEIESRKDAPVQFRDIRILHNYRMGREIGIHISGMAVGLPKVSQQAVVRLQLQDASGKLLTRYINTAFEDYGAGKDLRIGKNDQHSGRSEYDLSHGYEPDDNGEELPDSVRVLLDSLKALEEVASDTVNDGVPGPYETIEAPMVETAMHDSSLRSVFSFFLPYQEFGWMPGKYDIQIAVGVADGATAMEAVDKALTDNPMQASELAGYMKLKYPMEIPAMKAYRFGIPLLECDGLAFNPNAMDFTLRSGEHDRAGFPDIYCGIAVGQWMAWTTPRYRNSLIATWNAPSDVIFLLPDDQMKICVMDFDFPSVDDVISCWEGSVEEITGKPEVPQSLQFIKVRELKVWSEEIDWQLGKDNPA